MQHDPFAEVIDELRDLKREYYAAIRNAHAAGLSVERIVGLVGFATARKTLGGAVDVIDGKGPTSHHRPVPTPAAMPARRAS